MRGILLLIALAFPFALASPIFWRLVAMQYAAAPVTYIEHDGTVRQALLGPKAPWPDWVLVPEAAQLTVRARFSVAATSSESGFGDLAHGVEPLAVVSQYVRALQAAGWQVKTATFQAPLPEIPPRLLVSCWIRATREGGDQRVIQASIELLPRPGSGAVHWSTEPVATWGRIEGEPC